MKEEEKRGKRRMKGERWRTLITKFIIYTLNTQSLFSLKYGLTVCRF